MANNHCIKFLICIVYIFCNLTIYSQCEIKGNRKLCANDIYFFSLKNPTGITSYNWDFNNSQSSKDAQAGMLWKKAGNYTITVNVTYTNGTTCTDTHQIIVYALPIPVFSYNIYNPCFFNNSVSFLNLSYARSSKTDIKKIYVTYGDGSSQTINTPSNPQTFNHNFNVAGNNKVRFEITDFDGCIYDTSIYVKILQDIKPKIIFTEKIDCGKHELCIDATIDSMGLAGNSFSLDIDGNTTTSSYFTKKCTTFYNLKKNIEVKLTATNKNNCTNSDIKFISILSDTIFAQLFADTLMCLGDNTKKNVYISTTNIGCYFEWWIDNKYYTNYYSDISASAKILYKTVGYHELKVVIVYGKCKREIVKKIHVTGFESKVQLFNEMQCIDVNNSPVYAVEFGKISKPRYFWHIEDSTGTNCTINRKKLINNKLNCNNAVDYWAKHKFSKPGTYKITYNVYDSATTCSDTQIFYARLYNCAGDQGGGGGGGGGSSNWYLNKCVGDLFLYNYEVPYFKPSKFSFDSGITWRNFPDAIYAKDTGWKNTLFFIPGQTNILSVDDNDTMLNVQKNNIPPFTVYWKKRVFISNPKDFELNLNQSGNCDSVTYTFTPKSGKFKNGESIVVLGQIRLDTMYKFNATDTIPFTSYSIKLKKGESKRIIIYSGIGKCSHVSYHYLGFGQTSQIILPNLCSSTDLNIMAVVKENKDTFIKWTAQNNNGTIYWNINGTDTFKNKYNLSYAANKLKNDIMLIVKSNSGCIDTIKKSFGITNLKANIKHFISPLTCSELTQFFDSSILENIFYDSILNYHWKFINNSIQSNLKNPVFSYEGGGDFSIKLYVKTALGCIDSVEKKLSIIGPKPKFSITSDTIGCAPLQIDFKNESKNCSNYIWFFNDDVGATKSTKSDTNVVHIYKKTGRYFPKLVGSGMFTSPLTGNTYQCNIVYPGLPPHDSLKISVLVLPSDSILITGPDTICKNTVATFYTDPKNYFKDYYWNVESKKIYTVQNKLTYLFDSIGTFTISANYGPNSTATKTCTQFIDKKITVVAIKADFTYDDVLSPYYQFTNQSPGANWFFWNFGDPKTGSENYSNYENPIHKFSQTMKEFTICLLVKNNIGCRDSICKIIKIKPQSGILIPNVFTPNTGDDLNSEFDVKIDNEDFYYLEIYNRWGQVLYRSNTDGLKGDGKNWNGRVHNTGAVCPEGEYFYKFIYSLQLEDKKYYISGVITLIRK